MLAPAYSSLLFDVIGSRCLVGMVELNTLNQFQLVVGGGIDEIFSPQGVEMETRGSCEFM